MFFYYLLILIVLILIIAGFIKWCKDLRYIFENLRIFRYLFKKTTIKKGFTQLFVFIFLMFISVSIPFGVSKLLNANCNSVSGSGLVPEAALLKSVRQLSQVLNLTLKQDGSIPYKSIDEFSKMFVRTLRVISYNFDNEEMQSEHIKMNFSEKEINAYNLSEYLEKPMFLTADNVLYIIDKFTSGCNIVDYSEPDNSDCIMIVDINGYKKPNQLSTDLKHLSDRYKVVINGNKNEVIAVHEVSKELIKWALEP